MAELGLRETNSYKVTTIPNLPGTRIARQHNFGWKLALLAKGYSHCLVPHNRPCARKATDSITVAAFREL